MFDYEKEQKKTMSLLIKVFKKKLKNHTHMIQVFICFFAAIINFNHKKTCNNMVLLLISTVRIAYQHLIYVSLHLNTLNDC